MDFGAHASFGVPVGRVNLQFNGTYLTSFYNYFPDIGRYGDKLAARSIPRVATNASVVWETRPHPRPDPRDASDVMTRAVKLTVEYRLD